jgi:hypothetical protein
MSGYIGSQPVPQATQHRGAFTATASQTSFATAGYTPQFIDVYLNGVKLAPADYTATNGSDVVLTTGAAASDILEYVAYTPFEVADQTFTGTTTLTDSSAAPLVVNRTTSNGDITTFQKDGTTVGSIGAEASAVYVGKAETGVQFIAGAADRIVPYNTTTLAFNDGGISLGYPDARWSNAYLSGGVYLGGTGAANKLDDYEEGTWTPAVTGVPLTLPAGTYTKIGELVTCTFYFDSVALTSGLQANMTGMPFVNKGIGDDGRSAGYLTFNESGQVFTLLYLSGNDEVQWRNDGTGAAASRTVISGNIFWGTLIYRTIA